MLISPVNFGAFPYSPDGQLNGIEVMAMNSQENADNVINDFEKAFTAGMNPNHLLSDIMDQRNLTVNDFTDYDIQRVNRRVESIYKTVDYQAWRQQ